MSALFSKRVLFTGFSFRSSLIFSALKEQRIRANNVARFHKRHYSRSYKSRKWKLGMGVLGGGLFCLSIPILKDDKFIQMNNEPPKSENIEWGPYGIPISKKVEGPNKLEAKLTLFQYQTCPFCCKVRAFLDYYGIPYDVVEVNPVFRTELKFSEYKKVPIVILEQKPKQYTQLNDSSAIISMLETYFMNPEQNFDNVLEKYPTIISLQDSKKEKKEIMNRYHVMFGEQLPPDRSFENIREEIKWRKWVDEVFVHYLSPNIYRTMSESYESFQHFSEVGEWHHYFTYLERQIIILVGSAAMYLVGKRLKSKHGLKDDVRASLYEQIQIWTRAVSGNRFRGGRRPDLSDLAMFGVLNSIEGCAAFDDLMKRTGISEWYSATKEAVKGHAGRIP